jgi:hypothetical protein
MDKIIVVLFLLIFPLLNYSTFWQKSYSSSNQTLSSILSIFQRGKALNYRLFFFEFRFFNVSFSAMLKKSDW